MPCPYCCVPKVPIGAAQPACAKEGPPGFRLPREPQECAVQAADALTVLRFTRCIEFRRGSEQRGDRLIVKDRRGAALFLPRQ